MKKFLALLLPALMLGVTVAAADIDLPQPNKTGGMPLMDALQNRKSQRSFSEQPLSRQMLADLLWAANGVNREDGRTTAPTARNKQEISLYVCLPEGTFRYDNKNNKLIQTSEQRAGDAPVMLLIVADMDALPLHLCHVDAGYVSQNIYLFCAAQNLATVVRGAFKKEDYLPLINLPGKNELLYVQPVGFPK